MVGNEEGTSILNRGEGERGRSEKSFLRKCLLARDLREVREPYRRAIQAEGTGLKKRKLLFLKDVYQKFKYYADEISFVGFCKMKIAIFLESYGSVLNSFAALFLQYEEKESKPKGP